MAGREVATLVRGTLDAGSHAAVWNTGRRPSGVYYVRLSAGGDTETRKLALMR